MADIEQVDLLLRDVEAWNRWREEHRGGKVDLSAANLNGANLTDTNLSGVNLSKANLIRANLSNANLTSAQLISTWLIGANLSNANLINANIIAAILTCADLSNTNLVMVRALRTDFSQTILTGVCIEDWQINSETKFELATCDYVYLKEYKQERRPSDPNKNFAPGEFTKLFQKAISTVDLIFRNGINWEAFAHSFQQLQVKAGTKDLSIQAIENKGDGDFVIRVNNPPGADKAEIQRFVEQDYQVKLKAIEDKYRYQLQAKEESIAQYRQENTNLWSMAKLMASRPINVENKAVAESKEVSKTTSINIKENNGNVASENYGSQETHHNNYASQEKQTLAEAAEIQRLLQQLEETNPSANETEQIAYVNLATKPDLKQRAIAALKAGGDTAIDKFLLENKYLKVTKAVIQGWLKPNS